VPKILYETTVGRAILSEILPQGPAVLGAEQAAEEEGNLALINTSFRKCGLRRRSCSPTS
jgi:DNA-directed RNA polymerase subunit beta'